MSTAKTGVVLVMLMCGVMPQPHRDVTTTQGAVRGYRHPEPPHFSFLGVPYGRPPTRRDRFKPPKPPRNWDGIYEATHRIKCLQPYADGTRNCLVLNIFSPENATSQPVLVHLHGGGFQRGWASFQPPRRLLRKGIIVVTINYRLGPLGFLCLGTKYIPGNVGLKDQIAALYWIRKNIEKFGGRPQDVTAYGTGSGAASLELLLLSGLTRGLLNQAILESGSALAPSSLDYNPLSTAYTAAQKLGYDYGINAGNLSRFFRSIPTEKLISNADFFLPCVDGSLFTNGIIEKDPVLSFSEKTYHQVVVIMTFTNYESATLVQKNLHRFNMNKETFDDLLPTNLKLDEPNTKKRIGEIVRDFYLNEDLREMYIVQGLVDYINDIFTGYPVVKSATMHAEYGSSAVYLMEFNYKGSSPKKMSLSTEHMNINKIIFSDEVLNKHDEHLAQMLVAMWSNFILLGDPTPIINDHLPIQWKAVQHDGEDITNINCLFLSYNQLKLNPPMSGQRLAFWDKIYKKFYKTHEPIVNSES